MRSRWLGWAGVVVWLAACAHGPVAPSPTPVAPTPIPVPAGPRAQLAEAAGRHAALADYAQYLAARDAERSGHGARARARAQDVLDERPSIWAGPAMLLMGRTLVRSGNTDAARDWLAAARGVLPRGHPLWLRASLALAELDGATGRRAEALAIATEVRNAAPRRLVARRARRVVTRLRGLQSLEPDGLVDEANLRLREGDPAGAVEAATAALDRNPSASVVAAALVTRARAERAFGDLGNAEATCREVGRRLPGDSRGGGALAMVAGWYWNANDDARAQRLFGEVLRRFPRSGAAADALYAIGRIHQEATRWDDAFAAYDRLVRRGAGPKLLAEARWRRGWVRYLAGRHAEAEREFRRLAQQGGADARATARYWRARTLAHLGRPDDARAALELVAARHPTSYYAQLAAERLGRDRPAAPAPAPHDPPALPREIEGRHAERARVLLDLGFAALARREVAALDPSRTPTSLLLAAYDAVDAPGRALRLAQRARLSAAVRRRRLYPLGYWKIVFPEARARGIDPLLAAALIRQESLFDPDAVSPANAHGLMQLLPSTAADVSRTLGAPPPDVSALHEPTTNVRLGMALLERLIARYDGTVEKALAAYNGGEDAVARWERRYAGRDLDEFVELISYRETRHYVKAVLSGYRVYQELYAESPSATSAGSPPNAPLDMITMTSPSRADSTR